MRRALILDLDYTLLHLEELPGAIEVPGRTRSAYLSVDTASALSDLSGLYDIILATARSWHGTVPVVRGLARHGVAVSGVVLEDGALVGAPGDYRPLEPGRSWEKLRVGLEGAAGDMPAFSWQEDFEACLVARAVSPEEAAPLLTALRPVALSLDPTLRLFQDGRKVYVTGKETDKWTALVALLGERAASAAGVGDGANDVCWLSRIDLPCTFAEAAPEVVALVREMGGLISRGWGHGGIEELLREVARPKHDAPENGLRRSSAQRA